MTDSTRNMNPSNNQKKTMQKIWQEEDVTLGVLAPHLGDSGLELIEEDSRIMLHTEAGTGYLIRLDTERKFVRFSTVLPLDAQQSLATRKDFALALNEDFSCPRFLSMTAATCGYAMSCRTGRG